MATDLTGHVIVITGASSGIGAATAIACAAAGMDVVLNARRAEKLETVAEEVRRRRGRAALVVGDVVDQGVSARMLDVAEHHFGRCDAVFANAGHGLELPVIDTTEEQLRQIFDVNFFSGVGLLRMAAQRWLVERRRGHLMMCSSCIAKFTLPYYSAYSATKAAQNHICRAMRLELEPQGIHVTSVHPITTTTEFFQVTRSRSGRGPRNTRSRDGDDRAVPDHTSRFFLQPPERVARAIVKCLRKPRAEVWTSHLPRLAAGLFTVFPSVFDMAMRAQVERKARRHEGTKASRLRRDKLPHEGIPASSGQAPARSEVAASRSDEVRRT